MQGDTGHANSQMVTEVYAEIVDEDRKYNAQRFEQEFYCAPIREEPAQAAVTEKATPLSTQDLATLLAMIQNNPGALAGLLANPNAQTSA